MQKNEVILYRSVKGRWRYYSICYYKTLFDEYVLVKKYGAVQNKSPTGKIFEYYEKLSDVSKRVRGLIQKKTQRGYRYELPLF